MHWGSSHDFKWTNNKRLFHRSPLVYINVSECPAPRYGSFVHRSLPSYAFPIYATLSGLHVSAGLKSDMIITSMGPISPPCQTLPARNMRSIRCPVLWPWWLLTLEQGKDEKLFWELIMTRSDIFDLIDLHTQTEVHTNTHIKNMKDMKDKEGGRAPTPHSNGWRQLLARCQEMWNSYLFLLILMSLSLSVYCHWHVSVCPWAITQEWLKVREYSWSPEEESYFSYFLNHFWKTMSSLQALFCNLKGNEWPEVTGLSR